MMSNSNTSSAFNDDPDWASSGASPQSASAPAGDGSRMFISEEFLDDFDDDDDAFFSSATGSAVASPGGMADSRVVGANKSALQSGASTFGMVALSYDDVAPSSTSMSMRSSPRPSSLTVGQSDLGDSLEGEDISDDAELLELDQRHLVHLRNPNSAYRVVARTCLALHQLVYSTDQNSNQSDSFVSSSPIQIESSSIYHIQRHQRLIHRILSSLKTCLSSHNSPSCRSLACRTLASTARASYARLRFDARLMSVRLPPSIATRLEDECGNGAAYALVVAAIEQGNDAVSSAALEALGRLTLDPRSDNLAAEVRVIAECANPNVFMYENDSKSCWILEHSHAMRELQSKAWEHVVFPRMQHILHRLSLYSSPYHLAKSIPVVTAAFVHALTHGRETNPSRRALQTGKVSHGKRGWREVDADGLAKEYVEGILLPCFASNSSFNGRQLDNSLQRAIVAACIRMSSASPHATWRLSACRHATTVLLQQLKSEMGLISSSAQASWKSSPKLEMTSTNNDGSQRGASSPISSTLSSSSVPIETLAGTAAMLVIALRGIPLHERAPGLTAVLRATLMYLPLGIPVPSGNISLDLPVGTVQANGRNNHYRLGRIGLITEVALSIMVDGSANTNHTMAQGKDGTDMIPSTRSLLLKHVLHSDILSSLWEESTNRKDSTFQPLAELLWVFCTVATETGKKQEHLFTRDNSIAKEWSSIGLVLLDFFAGIICNPFYQSRSPFMDASHAAYNGLFIALLKCCGSLPPSTLSISNNMLPNSHDTGSVDKASPVVGGPGKQLHDVALALSKIITKILFLVDKSKNAATHSDGHSLANRYNIIQMAALLVDAWLGLCIMNHDAKQSNEAQLSMALMFLPLCRSEIEMLIGEHRGTRHDSIEMVSQLSPVLIACLENVACMSDILVHTAENDVRAGAPGKDVVFLTVSMLNEIVSSAKEGPPTDKKEDSMIRYQIAMEANNAISRIQRNKLQTNIEDIASAFHVSPLLANANPKSLPSRQRKPVEQCAQFFYQHAVLALKHQIDVASKAAAPTTSLSGLLSSSKLIHPRNALRLTNAFSHSTIDMYQKVRDLPLMIPTSPSSRSSSEAVTLSGCSDPFSLTLSHNIRLVRKGDSSEGMVLVVTMRLYNITPVPIQNGIRLDLHVSQESGINSTCLATSVYKSEIKGGDFVTWEVSLGNWNVGNINLQPSVTFRELEQETSTQKWVSGGGPDTEHAMPSEAMEDDDEQMLDVMIPCKPITISTITSLMPCPLVFSAGLSKCGSNVGQGDTSSFQHLWERMENNQCTIPFIIPNAQMEGRTIRTLADTKKGFVTLANSTPDGIDPITGCAFVAPTGNRLFCEHQAKAGEAHVLHVRSDSPDLLEMVSGSAKLQTSFLQFIFGATASVIDTSSPKEKQPVLGHDLPSVTMGHDFPSMTMPARRPILS